MLHFAIFRISIHPSFQKHGKSKKFGQDTRVGICCNFCYCKYHWIRSIQKDRADGCRASLLCLDTDGMDCGRHHYPIWGTEQCGGSWLAGGYRGRFCLFQENLQPLFCFFVRMVAFYGDPDGNHLFVGIRFRAIAQQHRSHTRDFSFPSAFFDRRGLLPFSGFWC